MRILIGKIGRPIFFNKKRWDMYAGDEEGPLLYRMLATRHPEHTFYLIGRSDFDDSGEMLPGNIVNLFDGCPTEMWCNAAEGRDSRAHFWLMDNIKARNLRFDVGVFYLGPSSCVSIPGVGMKQISGEESKSLQMLQNYGAPILHTLNETGTPYFLLCGDPRYLPWRARDVFNDEKFILSQVNAVMPIKRVKSYADQTIRMHNIRYEYGAIETIFMLQEQKFDFRFIEKDIKFGMFLNGKGSFSKDREEIATDWVLKKDPNVKIYGVWNDDFTSKWPGRFEATAIADMESTVRRVRYTLVPPFTNNKSHFVTQKFWKMIYYGIMPFFHPKYDTGKIFKVPSELRPYGARDMWERIEHFESHPNERQDIVNQLYDLLDDSYFNGDFLHAKISDAVQRCTGNPL